MTEDRTGTARRPEAPSERTAAILCSLPLPEPADGTDAGLPFGMHLLGTVGWRPVWAARPAWYADPRSRRGRLAAAWERRTLPFVQTVTARHHLRRADVVLAMFESEGHLTALLRHVAGRSRRRPPLVIVACWLTELGVRDDRRRRLYRWLYRSVDRVVVLSTNQRQLLHQLLDIPLERITVVPFGIEPPALDPGGPGPGHAAHPVVAAGRDLGRDWATLAAAARGATWEVDLITRPRQVADLALPDNVHLRGYLPPEEYLALVAAAEVVVIPTEVRAYPSGQTVLLEAMALGRAVVLTDTPAMADYVEHDVTAVLVPPADPHALRAAVEDLLADPERRAALGAAAREAVSRRFTAAHLWSAVGAVLDEVVGVTDGPGVSPPRARADD